MSTPTLEQQADTAAGQRHFSVARDLLSAAVQAEPGQFDLWLKLAAMHRATGNAPAALSSIDRALALRPLDFTALLMRATHLHGSGDEDRAGEGYGRALAQAPTLVPPFLEPALQVARQRYRAWQDKQRTLLRSVVTQPVSPSIGVMIDSALRLVPPEREGPAHYCYPGLPALPFYDHALFPWIKQLEAATDEIAAEFAVAVAAQSAQLTPYIHYPDAVPLHQWETLNNNRDWTAIHLVDRGRDIPSNTQHCPRTMALLREIPQPHIRGAGPNAMFSLLAPHTHIPPHTGVTNTRLVCHLPLIVPDGCWFRVGSEKREWRRGEAWVFDDTIDHEAMNPTDRLRVLLIVDVWHPDLRQDEQANVASVIGAGGQVNAL